MNLATSMTLWASSTALLLSIGALCVALLSWRRSRSTSSAALSHRLSEQEATVESLSAQLRQLRSRLNMQAYRQRQRAEEPPETTEPIDPDRAAEDIRRQLNDGLARGTLKGVPT